VSLEAIVVASSEQIACDVGDETVVLNLKDGVYYSLNSVASLVWKSIQNEKKVADIREILMNEYEVALEACTDDLLTLLSELATWRLVEIRNGKMNGGAPLESKASDDL
jgi:hypothetical protein